MKTKKSRAILIVVLVITIFVISACRNESKGASSSKGKEYDTEMREGKQSISEKNYAGAEEAFNEDLVFKEKDAATITLLNQTKDYISTESKFMNGKLEETKGAIEKIVKEKTSSKDLVKVGKVKEEQVAVSDSKNKTERNTELVGKDIKTATDDNNGAWLTEKSATQSSGTTETDGSASDERSSTDSSKPEVSLDTDKNNVLTAVEQMTNHSSQYNQYYIKKKVLIYSKLKFGLHTQLMG